MSPLARLSMVLTLVFVLVSGTVFFRIVEGWSWLDAYFFTVVTVSTVGYGDPVPVTALGKLGTTVFIFTGLGIFAVVIQQFAEHSLRKRNRTAEYLVARLGHAPHPDRHGARSEDEDAAPANADDAPDHR